MGSAEEKAALLKGLAAVDASAPMPLYAQLRRGLRRLIEEHFEHGDAFYNEQVLHEQLGVAVTTARRALSDLVAQGLLERKVARGTFVRKEPRSGGAALTVGIFLPDFDLPFNTRMLEELSTVCREQGLHLRTYHTHKGRSTALALQQVRAVPPEEAFVLLNNDAATTLQLYEELTDRGFRCANIDALVEGFEGTHVGVDNALGVRLGMEYPLTLGHRRIAFWVTEPEEQLSIQERIRTFEDVVEQRRLEGCRAFTCGVSLYEKQPASWYHDRLDELLRKPPGLTALFSASDPGALLAIQRLSQRSIRVPEEVSVLGFDGLGLGVYSQPPLSTVAQPFEAIARRAVAFILEPAAPPRRELLPPTLVIRSSTAPPIST